MQVQVQMSTDLEHGVGVLPAEAGGERGEGEGEEVRHQGAQPGRLEVDKLHLLGLARLVVSRNLRNYPHAQYWQHAAHLKRMFAQQRSPWQTTVKLPPSPSPSPGHGAEETIRVWIRWKFCRRAAVSPQPRPAPPRLTLASCMNQG